MCYITLTITASLCTINVYDVLHIGHRKLMEFSLKNVINTLHAIGFADADCEKLGLQLDLSEQMKNIRY